MEVSNFLNIGLQKGDGLLLKYDTGEIMHGNYRGEYDSSRLTFSFYNSVKDKIETISIKKLDNLDITSRV